MKEKENLTLRELMEIANEATDGQLTGYYDEDSGEPTIDYLSPTKDAYAIYTVETIAANYDTTATKGENIRRVHAAFANTSDGLSDVAAAFAESPKNSDH